MTVQGMTATRVPMPKPHRDRGIEGRMATWYAATTAKSMHEFQELAQRIRHELPANGSVLEIAPGPGYLCIELARPGACRVTGVDLSADMVRIARRNAEEAGVTAEFVQGNSSDLPFADDCFDFLVCRAAFKNFARPVRALQEMHRVLKPGGTALVIDLRRDASMQAIREWMRGSRLGLKDRVITALTFRFLLIPSAYAKEHFDQMLTQTEFHKTEIAENGIGFEIRMTK